jgi:hypothetical protein
MGGTGGGDDRPCRSREKRVLPIERLQLASGSSGRSLREDRRSRDGRFGSTVGAGLDTLLLQLTAGPEIERPRKRASRPDPIPFEGGAF